MEPKSSEGPRKKVAYGAAGLSLFIHLGLFLLVGSVVIVEYAVPRSPMTGEVVTVVSSEQNSSDESPENVGEPEAMAAPSVTASASQPLQPMPETDRVWTNSVCI